MSDDSKEEGGRYGMTDIMNFGENRATFRKLIWFSIALAVIPISVFFISHWFIMGSVFLMNKSSSLTWSGALAVITVKIITVKYAWSAFKESEHEKEE